MTPNWPHIALVTLWVLWVVQAVLCAIQAGKFGRHLRRGDRAGFAEFRPPAVVFVPFKGLDHDAVANLHGLLQQDYPGFRCVFIVESEDDPAFTFLTEETAKYPAVQTDVVVAGVANHHTGQKVHNLLGGLRFLGEQREGLYPEADEAWVFADSDAVPNPQWLGNLVGPLAQRERNAVTTGYRWLVPARGPRGRFKLGGQIASVINAGVATFAANDRFDFAWGGSMAMLADTAERGGLIDLWLGALSDDYQVTRMARQLKQRIYFLPECIVESPMDMTLSDLAEFARRQYVITRTHEPWFFWRGLGVVAMYVAAVVSAWGALLSLPWTRHWALGALAGVAVVIVFVCNQVRSGWRRYAVQELFGSGTFERLAPALRLDRWAITAIMALNLGMLASAAFGRHITWRGKRYELRGPQNIRRLGPPAVAS